MVERSKTELIGKLETILHPPEDIHNRLSTTFIQHSKNDTGQPLKDTLISKTGKLIPVEIKSGRIRNNEKELIIGIFRDITERQRAEESITQAYNNMEMQVMKRTSELAEANFKLQKEIDQRRKLIEKEKEQNVIKSQFVSTVSHEFRTPLAGIHSSVQLLKLYGNKWDEKKKEEIYKKIFDSIQHNITLLDDVSLINKGGSNTINITPSMINLHELLRNIIEENKQVYSSDFEIVTTILLAKSQYFFDKETIRHIIGNVLSNAMKYSDKSKKIIFNATEENDKILFNVIDYGIGIPKKDQKLLFKPFYRASNVEAIRGTGLGLSIVKQFVDMLDGEIEIVSEVGKGTNVLIKLPLAKNNEAGS